MIIRIPNWLGDALMATPVYYNLSQFLSSKEKLYFFGPPGIVDLFKFFPKAEIIYYKKNNTKENLKALSLLKKETGLLLPNSFSSAWLFFRARLKERWGYAKNFRSFLLTKAVKPPAQKLHQRDYYLNLLEKLGLPSLHKELGLPLSEELINQAKEFLKAYIKNGEPFVVFAPGAAYGPAKMWPKEYYKTLSKLILKQGYKIVICGTEREKEIGEFIKEGSSFIINLCGKTDILTVSGIFYLSKAIISNDSGLMHLAAALKKPQIAIFGSTDPKLTCPLNPYAVVIKKDLPCSPCFKRTCKYKHYKCLYSITPSKIYSHLEKLLND